MHSNWFEYFESLNGVWLQLYKVSIIPNDYTLNKLPNFHEPTKIRIRALLYE